MTNLNGKTGAEFPTSDKAISYARVSSKEQDKEGFSIAAQQKLIRSYARERQFVIAKEFVDVETAKTTGRASFTEMLQYIKKHPAIRTILVEKTDRLYRNLKDWVTLDEFDIEIHLVKEGIILSRESRSSEKFVHGIKVLMAKNYIDNLSEEARKGQQEKADQGIWPTKAPLGYLNVVGSEGKRIIAPDPEVAPLILKMFVWYAAGTLSMKEVAEKARAEGLVYRRTGAPVPTSAVHTVLRNRIYTGEFIWKGRRYRGRHQPFIHLDLYERVQEVIANRMKTKKRRTKREFAFSTLVACGHCGCAMVGELKKGRYIYYHCTGYKGKCPNTYVREEVLSERFADLLARLRFDDAVFELVHRRIHSLHFEASPKANECVKRCTSNLLILVRFTTQTLDLRACRECESSVCVTALVRRGLRESHVDEAKEHKDAIARHQAEYDRLQARLYAIYIDKLDGRIDNHFFDKLSEDFRLQQDKCLREISRHQDADQSYLEEGIGLLELAQNAHRLFEKEEPLEKRRLLNFVLSNSSWKDGELSASYRQPFDLLAEKTASVAQADEKNRQKISDHSGWLGR